MAERAPTDGPWCWQSKEIRRLIRASACDDHGMKRDALAVYAALTEIASDKQKETFQTTHSFLFERSGVSVSKIKLVLSFLRGIHLIVWETPMVRAPCTYTLLAYHEPTIAQPELTLSGQPVECQVSYPQANDSHSKANDSQNTNSSRLATSEESEEESLKNPEKNGHPSLLQWQAEARTRRPDWPDPDSEAAWSHYQANGWRTNQGAVKDWKACIVTCYHRWKTNGPHATPTSEQRNSRSFSQRNDYSGVKNI